MDKRSAQAHRHLVLGADQLQAHHIGGARLLQAHGSLTWVPGQLTFHFLQAFVCVCVCVRACGVYACVCACV